MTTSTKITSVNPFVSLTWGQRLQVISDYRVSVKAAAKIMAVSESDLEVAIKTTVADVSFDTSEYSTYFKNSISTSSVSKDSSQTTAVAPKKRGRKTSKIRDAFNAITSTPQPLYEFCQLHGVSEHCMRQHSRFAPDRTDIVIRKVKGENTVPMIWIEEMVTPVVLQQSVANPSVTVGSDTNLLANISESIQQSSVPA
jgi:hypothetical protein